MNLEQTLLILNFIIEQYGTVSQTSKIIQYQDSKGEKPNQIGYAVFPRSDKPEDYVGRELDRAFAYFIKRGDYWVTMNKRVYEVRPRKSEQLTDAVLDFCETQTRAYVKSMLSQQDALLEIL